jgi:uncharacterized repeat protein (TIGR01451 family)
MKHAKDILMTFSILFSTALFSASALAEIKLVQTAEVEVVTKDAKGKETIKLAPAEKVIPGDTIVYTITATNTGKAAADNVVINNAISEHNLYLNGSAGSVAIGKNTTITFSADGGKTFADAQQLTIVENGETRLATPEDYTNIRWQLNFPLAPEKSTKVFFKTLLK